MILFQLQLPTMPNTPCAVGGSCSLTGQEQLRYLSLTFSFNLSGDGNASFVANPDGLNDASSGPVSLISLSDQAFETVTQSGNNYANLLVNVDPSFSGSFQTFVANHQGVQAIKGVSPPANGTTISNSTAYNVFQLNNGFTALDLTQLSNFGELYNSMNGYQAPLELDLRNTLPNTVPGSQFTQSGLAVPFSTTQYLGNGQGIMGAYVPLVSYVALSQLPQVNMVPAFPTAGTPPAYPPDTNISEIYQPNQPLIPQSFPEQYWPSTKIGGVKQLLCGALANPTTQIDFVGTQFSVPVDNMTNFPTSPTNCNTAASYNSCSQIFFQLPQAAGNMSQNWQPGLPLTIEGQGFGYLPEITLPYATTGWAGLTTSYLTITDTPSNGVPWTSPNKNCQMLIVNWSPTAITVVPNVEAGLEDGSQQIVVSPLTDTSPFSLGASTSCAVSSNDSIQVKVLNPQTGLSSTVSNLQVNTFAGSLN